MLNQGACKGGRKMLRRYFVERRQAEWRIPDFKEGILVFGTIGHECLFCGFDAELIGYIVRKNEHEAYQRNHQGEAA
jgi:hypothetical protein